MDPLHHLPLAEIDPSALLRDRTTLDPDALAQLQHSIATEGLRTPIEVWRLSTPREPFRYGLISGLRRLTAARALGHETIPAFLRSPQSLAQALTAMVSENEIRAPVSPWEKAALILNAVTEGHFPTPDAAIATLFPALPKSSHRRLRAHATVVEALGPLLTAPETLTTRQLDTLAAAITGGHEDLLTATLHPHGGKGPETQWSALRPVLLDIAREPANPTTRRPRRLLRLRQGLTITREPTPTGWLLRFTGPQARSPGLIDDVLDKVEEWFGRV
ncbi:ParB/RepB/Spo0J family partition protein [Tabrizicola thermarum]|uniref:ParB/RepB/Spo0J family partition protein n=1 Tax=Tabrizicola thermarum TaxID=2670345 RepID=UPI000FFB8017|nr:ParB N-terminal domain-containing protein [Tabrizicola thermarum]